MEHQVTTRLHQEKAFKNLLNATTSKFKGKDILEYALWKKTFAIDKRFSQPYTTLQQEKNNEKRRNLSPLWLVE